MNIMEKEKMSKRKLLDTFKKNDPNLSQLDSLKDLLDSNSIPYKETVRYEEPYNQLYDFNNNIRYHPSSPTIVENNINIKFSSVVYNFIFKNKFLSTFDVNENSSYNSQNNKNEDDSLDAVQDWVRNIFEAKIR